MITQYQIDTTVACEGLKEFGYFVLSYGEGRELPDYKKMDLMKIPHLVPHIWVYDLRSEEGREKLLINFAGGHHDTIHRENIIGKFDVDVFNGETNSDLLGAYKSSIENKTTAYTTRYEKYSMGNDRQRFRSVETLMFPCSTDEEYVNWAIGCAYYGTEPRPGKNIFLQF